MNPSRRAEKVDYSHRATVNLMAVIAIMLLAAGMFWIFQNLEQRRKLETCLATGRKDCFALPSQRGGILPPAR